METAALWCCLLGNVFSFNTIFLIGELKVNFSSEG
jgi:hypothetical protein